MTSPYVQRTQPSCSTPNHQQSQARLGVTPISRRSTAELSSPLRFSDDSQVLSITVGDLRNIVKETVESATVKKSTRKQDIKVDGNVKNGVHSAVIQLTESGKEWDFSVGFREGRNPMHTEEVLTSLRNLIGEFNRHMAHKACRTYFLTLKNRERIRKADKTDQKKKEQRKRQRKSSARERRLAVVQSMPQSEEKDKLKAVLQDNTYISSEESEEVSADSDSDTDLPKQKVFKKTILPWRSDYLTEMFHRLDAKRFKRQRRFRKGGAMMAERKEGNKQSERDEPEDAPEYAVQEFQEA